MTTTMPSPAMRAARARASAPRGVVRARGFATTTSASRATRSRDRRGVASAALGARARASDAGANGARARGLESRARAVSTPQGVDNAREGNDVERDAVTKTATAARDGGDGGATERASGEDDASASASAAPDDLGPVERKPFSAWRWVATRTLLLGLVARRAFAVLVWLVIATPARAIAMSARTRLGRLGLVMAATVGAGMAIKGHNAKKAAAPVVPTTMYSSFLKDLKGKKISTVRFEEGSTRLLYDLKPNAAVGRARTLQTKRLVGDAELMKKLEAAGVEFGAVPAAVSRLASRGMFTVLAMWLPIIPLMIIMRNAINRQSGAGDKKRKKAARTDEADKVTFADVAGVEEAKAELFELVQIMKNAEKYKNVRGRLPTGCLLVGPPGTGKTLLARAVAGESGVAFFPVAASEFVELFVGRGAARVRELFAEARKARPAIIFIDELDAVGSRRGAGLNEERDQTLNQLLVEMDGFAKDSGILILAATNRPDALDPALLRPGRLTRRVFVGPPTQQGRAQILSVHLRGLDLEDDVDVVCDVISRATPGFTGAELANVANEAALLSVRDGRQLVSIDDMLDGVSRTKDGIATSGNRADAMFRELRSRFLGNYKDAPGSTTDAIKEKLGSKASAQGVPISMGPS